MADKSIVLFCANQYEGGVAKIFVEIVNGLNQKRSKLEIIAMIDAQNSVKQFDEIQARKIGIDVISRENFFPDRNTKHGRIYKLLRNLYRSIRFLPIQRKNNKEFRKQLRLMNVSVVMAHSGGYHADSLCIEFLKAARDEKIRNRIIVFHNDFEKKSKLEKLYYFIYDIKINRLASNIVVVSNFMKKRLQVSSFLNATHVLYNGIKSREISVSMNTRANTDKAANTPIVIGMIGNFEERKGHLFLLEAINMLSSKNNIRIEIIGNIFDSNYYESCLDYIKKHHIEEIVEIRTGIHDAWRYVADFDIFVFPSIRDESFGLVALEAMMFKVPVVAFRCGGIPEVVQDLSTGYIVDIEDVSELASKIESLVNNGDLRRELGENGQKVFLEKFSLNTMIDRYSQLIECHQ
ncbi:MAG: glycosyltransferase family 1 protein [Bacteroidia bacterium]|nr:glycosyltransferase family 1 protein [Bacteroidia bacterium]